jgi:heat shock protein HslJ
MTRSSQIRNKKTMNKTILLIVTLLTAAVMLLAACSPKAAAPALPGTSWKLVSYGAVGSQTPAAPDVETSLVFGKDGQVSGSLGCNSFSGGYEVKNGKLVFGLLASTLMACPDPQMTQEGTAFQVLTGTVRFEVSGNTLTIYDASGVNALTLSGAENK